MLNVFRLTKDQNVKKNPPSKAINTLVAVCLSDFDIFPFRRCRLVSGTREKVTEKLGNILTGP